MTGREQGGKAGMNISRAQKSHFKGMEVGQRGVFWKPAVICHGRHKGAHVGERPSINLEGSARKLLCTTLRHLE